MFLYSNDQGVESMLFCRLFFAIDSNVLDLFYIVFTLTLIQLAEIRIGIVTRIS